MKKPGSLSRDMHPIPALNSALLDYSPQRFAEILQSLVFAIKFYCAMYLDVNPAKVDGPGLVIQFEENSNFDISTNSIATKSD